jgi:hypothetical protein
MRRCVLTAVFVGGGWLLRVEVEVETKNLEESSREKE